MGDTWQGGVRCSTWRSGRSWSTAGRSPTGGPARGPTLLLVHGGLSDGREWLPVMSRLADVADLVAMDVPGCGASDDPPDGSSLADIADVVAGFVHALGLERPHLGGLSYGGGLALQVATRHPDLPGSLVLMSGYAGWGGSLEPEELAVRLAWARTLVEEPPHPDPVAIVPGLLGSGLAPELADLLAQATAGFRPGPTRVLLEGFAVADLRDELSAVRCPTVVVHGELDARAPRPVADALHRGIPGSRLVCCPVSVTWSTSRRPTRWLPSCATS